MAAVTRGRRHFPEPRSLEVEQRPHARQGLEPKRQPNRPQGLRRLPEPGGDGQEQSRPEARHFPERAAARDVPTDSQPPRRDVRPVVDKDGRSMRLRRGEEVSLETYLGCRKKVPDQLARRNGIPCKMPGDKLYATPDLCVGYYNNKLWGGGVVPGSNFGFARATETTRESQRIFGKSLAELWCKCPEVPIIVDACLERLEAPDVLKDPSVFEHVLFDLYNEEPVRRLDTITNVIPAHLGSGSPKRVPSRERQQQVPPSSRGSMGGDSPSARSTARHTVHSTARSSSAHTTPTSAGRSVLSAQQSADAQSEREARLSEIRILRGKVDRGRGSDIDLREFEPRVALGLLVRFLLDLKQPVLTFDLYEKIMRSQEGPTDKARVEALKPTLAKLPAPNEAVLFALFRYLNQVWQMPESGVTPKLIAQVFGPAILREDPRRPALASLSNEALKQTLRDGVIECMLEYAIQVFPASALRPRRTQTEAPFELRRRICLAVQDFDMVQSLEAWEVDQELCDTGRSAASLAEQTQRIQHAADKAAASAATELAEEKNELDELQHLINNYSFPPSSS
mmetsp:Transcript_3240/g.9899  ORF Transcript_3240/g.9899 Transcript_3240/m.9899 type:complete len:568 (-) Transcript_3240:251-1954(-)